MPAILLPFSQRQESWPECDGWDSKPLARYTEGPHAIELVALGGSSKDLHQLEPRNEVPAAANLARNVVGWRLEDDYKVQSAVLGTGVNGQVRAAVCKHSGRRFAVKSFRRGATTRAWDDALNEADVYSSLEHPGVARLERVYRHSDDLHLVMECLEGGELFDKVSKSGACSEGEAADIIRQVLTVVAYLHSRHVAHCDLKLENVLFERKGSKRVKVIDFGHAQRFEKGAKMSRNCGTLIYSAPEVLAQSYTEKADMWSVGAILYALLVGRYLYHGSGQQLRTKVAAGKVHFAPGFARLSEGARGLVQSLLSLEPGSRPSASAALEHPWLQSTLCVTTLPKLWPSDLATWRSQFQLLETGGVITLQSLRRALGAAEAEAIFASLDANNDGEVSWSELLGALRGHVHPGRPCKLGDKIVSTDTSVGPDKLASARSPVSPVRRRAWWWRAQPPEKPGGPQ
eukprot:CAMPEP_0171066774 /NCGR_PEP_ID=MMETSP0766_2-20121228/7612_1 /TAXON_ID=439317 /ORGANISM="Gambierdiscus australes, Strain CAWD 149" /LENGTH=457 /DNA_ID=CAMNT_0011522963 /DNA_START=65 /DNA_END=1438 /DNA_ORIENTATION=-